MSDGSAPLTTTIEDGVAVIRLDDGKANALSYTVIDALNAGLDQAQADADAVCIVGRDGRFSAGFDLSVMSAGVEAARGLVGAGGAAMMRLYLHPQPVVAAVTGHALAAGALLALCCDIRVGADIPAKIGLNETTIGMPLPLFAIELSRERLSPRYLMRATAAAEIFDPQSAVDTGYLDWVVPADECAPTAIAEAGRLGALPGKPYGQTKQALRQPLADRVTAGAEADMQRFTLDS